MSGLRRFFSRVFDIRPGEWQRLLSLYAFAFLLNVSVVWGSAASESLFLKRVGVDLLPLIFVADALLTILTIIVYGAFVDRISNARLMVGISVFATFVLILTRFGIAEDIAAAYWGLYLSERVLRATISIHAWNYIADFYDTRTAKRHYPLLGSGSRTSGILAGLMIAPLVAVFQTENLVFAWIGAILAGAALAWIMPRFVKPESQAAQTNEETSSGVIENMRGGFTYVSNSAFLRLLAIAAFIGTFLLYFLDYQSQAFFVEYFESTEDLATFYGLLEAFVNVITLPIQMFWLSRLVKRLGVGNANMIFPGLSALAAVFLTVPALATAAFARVDRTALRSAFRTPIDSLLYNAVPLNVKGRARAFINGLLIPLGTLMAGILLLFLPTGNVLIGLSIGAGVVYVLVSIQIRREYGQSLTSLLTDDKLNIFRLSEELMLDQSNFGTAKILSQQIAESEDDTMTVFLAEMLFEAQGQAASEQLVAIANERSPAVRAGIIEIIGLLWTTHPSVRQLCLDGLNDTNVDIRRASVTALVDSGDVSSDQILLSSFLELLNDADQVIKTKVIPPLIASGDFFYLAPSVEILSSWLSNESNSRDRVLGLRVLAKTGSERLVRTIVRFLEDADPIVRRQAAGLIDDLTAQTPLDEMRRLGMQTLAALLYDEDESVRLAAVYGLGRFNTKEASQALMTALEDKNFRVRRQACISMSVLLQDQLERVLEQDDLCSESAAFILSVNNHTRARRRAVELMDKLVMDTYVLMIYRLSLKFYDTPGINLLRDILRENEILLLDRCFWLLSALSSDEQSLGIRRALETEDSLKRANALEALESLTSPALARRITPLFIHKRATQAIEEWMSDQNLKAVTKWETFFQLWSHLVIASNTTMYARELPLSDDDGWLMATTIFSLAEIDEADLEDNSGYSPIDKNTILEAVKSTIDNSNGVVQETVRIALNRLMPMTALGSGEVTMLSAIEKVIFLKEVPFFESMSISQLRILASISEEVSYDEGEEIFNEGEYGDALYVVVSGEVALQRRQTRGRRTSITRLTTHGIREYFAEMSIFDNAPHPHEAVALQPTELLIVRRDTLVSLIEHQPDLALNLLTVLSQRLREASGLIAEKSEAKPRELVDLFDRLK